ncbi:MAG TPA: MerR family transcriptional regulator [Solirubrobacteraceae bacterium]|nr:MerR family transcriptional regulator [Solirubrobacteraceae bacterium]
MGGLRTNAAAGILGVSPNTLRSWERRYGFPTPQRSRGGHRQYTFEEVEALRSALTETHNVSSAVTLAQQRGTGPASPQRLVEALRCFDEDAANQLLEESLALRSMERTIEGLLLEALGALAQGGRASAEYEFAWRYATGWLAAIKRLAPAAQREEGVLVLDASAALDMDALHAQALELILRRSGLRTLTLTPAIDPGRLGRAMRALRPRAIVLTGRWISLDVIGRVVYAVRSVHNEAIVFDFRGAIPDTGASTVTRLGSAPIAARDHLLQRLHDIDVGLSSTPTFAAG